MNTLLCTFTKSYHSKICKVSYLLLLTLIVFSSQAQRVYKNGIFGTSNLSKSGTTAPVGYEWSELQNDNGVTTESNGSAGFSSQSGSFRLADDFTIPAGQIWNISKLSFFVYQTGSPASPSPISTLYVRVYSGAPNAGGVIIYGDVVTNRLSSSTDTKMYRIFNSAVPTTTVPGTTRLIWKISANTSLNDPLILTSGTYWVEWTTTATNNGAHFCPASTVPGQRAPWTPPAANALAFTISSNTWALVSDTGNPATAPDVPQEFPFEIEYSTNCTSALVVGGPLNSNNQKARNTITTAMDVSNVVPIFAKVEYQAGNSILLNPGFKAEKQSVFTTKLLGDCL